MTEAMVFHPDEVWRNAGLPADLVPEFLRDNGWSDRLLTEVIDLARVAVEARTALVRECGDVAEPVATVARALVNLADRMAYMPDIGWPVERALPWVRVAASEPDKAALWSLMSAAALWGRRDEPIEAGEKVLGLVLTWQSVDESVAALAYAAGLTAVEALERQHAGTLDPETLRTLAGLRGHHLL